MENIHYVWKENIKCLPHEGMVTYLNMDELLAWTLKVRQRWITAGPAPSAWIWEDFPHPRVAVSPKISVPDHFFCGSRKFISLKLRQVLEDFCDSHTIEFHPATIVHGTRNLPYYCLNVLAVADPVDYPNSELTFWAEEDGGGIDQVIRLKIKSEFRSDSSIFVISKMETLKVINTNLKTSIERANCTGSIFVPLDGYDDLWMTRPGFHRD